MLLADEGDAEAAPVTGCQYRSSPDETLNRESRIRQDVFERVRKWGAASAHSAGRPAVRALPAQEIPRRNFIDDEVFGKLEASGVASARLTTDAEFVRRIHLDLTGRPPTPGQVREFLADESSGKRDALIERLLWSPQFTERWTLWMGDWLQVISNPVTNIQPQINGRNAFHGYVQRSVSEEKPLKDVAWEVVTANVGGYRPVANMALDQLETSLSANRPATNFDARFGQANFALMSSQAMGPIQDTYDLMLFRTASTFLGQGYYDCVLCHDGRGHLDQISLWGRRMTRLEAQKMAAFFSRMRFTRLAIANNPAPAAAQYPTANFYVNSYHVEDAATGNYSLLTNSGNRPQRLACLTGNNSTAQCPPGTATALNPEYQGTAVAPRDGNWRAAFAENMVRDRMFARNIANRLWKQMFSLGLVEPVDGLDPARLDPANPPPAPWSLQATHPELMERLADAVIASNYSLRHTLKLLAQSSAYQLSSRYDGEWKLDYVPLFARHYPRRLEAEEVHDAITQATNVRITYAIGGYANPIDSALQLPDTMEPRSNGTMAAWLNSFFRGNRDTTPRSQSGSILQQLNLMNSTFVLDRIRVQANPNGSTMAVSRLSSPEEMADQLYLLFLSRLPSPQEREVATGALSRAANQTARNAAVEDLAWALINKVEFLFSY